MDAGLGLDQALADIRKMLARQKAEIRRTEASIRRMQAARCTIRRMEALGVS